MQPHERKPLDAFTCNPVDVDKLSVFGSGYPLYLRMLWFIVLLLIVPFGVAASFYMMQHYSTHTCISIEKRNLDMKNLEVAMKKYWGHYGQNTSTGSLLDLRNEFSYNKKSQIPNIDMDIRTNSSFENLPYET